MRYRPMPNMSKCQKSARFLGQLSNRPTSILDTVHPPQCGCRLMQTLLPKHSGRSTHGSTPPDDTVCAAQEQTVTKLLRLHVNSKCPRSEPSWAACDTLEKLQSIECRRREGVSGLKNIRANSRTQVFHWNIHNQCHPPHVSVVLMLWPIGVEWLTCKTK